MLAQLIGSVEYTDSISAEEKHPLQCVTSI